MNLRYKVLVGYFILIVLIGFMASILVRERHRISEIDLQNSEVQQAIRDIHNVHRYITRLTMLGESVIDWNRTDCSHYRIQRLCTDSLLQALKFHLCVSSADRHSSLSTGKQGGTSAAYHVGI